MTALRWIVRTAGAVAFVLSMIAFTGTALAEASQAADGGAGSRCPTPNQRRLADENSRAGAYAPGPDVHQPVTLTPTSGSESLNFPFDLSRSEMTKILTFSVDSPMPIAAKDLEVAFQGDLRRTDEKAVFPLVKSVQQAAIIPFVRADGRLVSFYVCVDPGQPDESAPGRYQGKLAWDTKVNTTGGVPLVSPGEVPVEVTLQYRRWPLAWGTFLVAFLVGWAVKVANDMQRGQRPAGDGQSQQPAGDTQLQKVRSFTTAMGLTLPAFVIGSVFAFGVGFVAFWRGYYGNPEFKGNWTGDMATLFGTVFTAVVAAQVGTGALSRRGQP